mgnify:CR=1 FL=1
MVSLTHDVPSNTTRRKILGGITGSAIGILAGCLGDDPPLGGDPLVARCSARIEGQEEAAADIQVGRIDIDEELALGIIVPEEYPTNNEFDSIVVRNRDQDLIADIPLRDNRGMSSLDPDDYPNLPRSDGELYAVRLGQPPHHTDLTIEVHDPDGGIHHSTEYRHNCYSP